MRQVALAALAASAAFAAAAATPPPPPDAKCGGGACEDDEAGLLQTIARGGNQLIGHAARTADAEATAAFEAVFGKSEVPKDTVLEYDPDDIDKALKMGTVDNIGTSVPNFASVMDLTGLWYIKWTPDGDLAVKVYKKSRMEIAVTFADTMVVSAYSDPDSPFALSMPGQLLEHWAYSDSLLAQGQMFGHAINWKYCHNMTYQMSNSRHGEIIGIGPFNYINEDQWERPTSTEVGTFTYKLSRIVYANGTRTKHYKSYAKLMRGYKLRVWGNNNQLARCKATAPLSSICYTFQDLGNGC